VRSLREKQASLDRERQPSRIDLSTGQRIGAVLSDAAAAPLDAFSYGPDNVYLRVYSFPRSQTR